MEEIGETQEKNIIRINGMILKKVIILTKGMNIMMKNLYKMKMPIRKKYIIEY